VSRLFRSWRFVWLLLALAACAPPTPGAVQVETVEILILESFPVQVHAVARGTAPEGCAVEADAAQDGNTFDVSVSARGAGDEPCAGPAQPFELTVPLDAAGLPAGDYTVNVNGVIETFRLDVDNVLSETPEQPIETTTVTWEEAEQLIRNGEVTQVFQAHSLQVTLTLADGRQVVTTEPSIDAVFRVIQDCGQPCADILQATE
jgi:hypothetical protein